MVFYSLHLDIYQLIFDYLTQQELLDLLLINHTFYQQIMKYIPAKLLKTLNNKDFEYYGKMNMIVSIKLNTLTLVDWNRILCGACIGGHKMLAKLLIEKGADDWNYALYFACFGGHKMLAEFMIEKGANEWKKALYFACFGGHKILAELLIEKGANDWNYALYGACEGGHKMLAELMIEKGADNWNGALYYACRKGHKILVEFMIEKGATRCRYCFKSMEEHL